MTISPTTMLSWLRKLFGSDDTPAPREHEPSLGGGVAHPRLSPETADTETPEARDAVDAPVPLLVDGDGDDGDWTGDEEAASADDALARQARSEAVLAARGLAGPAGWPPVADDAAERLQAPAEAFGRACALLVVAARAGSLAGGDPLPVEVLRENMPAGFSHLSPREQAFMAGDPPDRVRAAALAWRYEAVLPLAWALGLVDDLNWPAATCDVDALTATLLDAPPPTALRAPGEILDALDLHERMHAILRQAALDGGEVPHLDAGVVRERCEALAWLTGDAAWDDVRVVA